MGAGSLFENQYQRELDLEFQENGLRCIATISASGLSRPRTSLLCSPNRFLMRSLPYFPSCRDRADFRLSASTLAMYANSGGAYLLGASDRL